MVCELSRLQQYNDGGNGVSEKPDKRLSSHCWVIQLGTGCLNRPPRKHPQMHSRIVTNYALGSSPSLRKSHPGGIETRNGYLIKPELHFSTMKPKFSIGDVVCVKLEYQTAAGEVVDLLGTGSTGQNLYLVKVPLKDDPSETCEGTYPDNKLEEVPLLGNETPFSARHVIDYLKAGALIDILGRASGGKNPSRALLRFHQGELTYTFIDDPEHLAGATIPFSTTDKDKMTGEYKICRESMNRVALYLRSFGLSREQANEVLAVFPTLPS